MTMIDTTYQVTDLCAVAGLSDGARIAANIANTRPDRIRTVGLFSPKAVTTGLSGASAYRIS